MKKFSLILAALLITVAASAQSWSSEWVPKHEFHIDAFGGISALNYTISPGFAPNATKPMFPDRLGGGAGLGYTLHFTEYWGLTTGAELPSTGVHSSPRAIHGPLSIWTSPPIRTTRVSDSSILPISRIMCCPMTS